MLIAYYTSHATVVFSFKYLDRSNNIPSCVPIYLGAREKLSIIWSQHELISHTVMT